MLKYRLARSFSQLGSTGRWRHNIEIVAVLLLSIATVFTAWSAYQATRWSGIQSKAYQEVSIYRIDSSREFTMAAQNFALDSVVFTLWANAIASGDEDLAAFLRERVMTESFLPVFDEWVATDPLNSPDSLRNPMANGMYREQLMSRTLELEALADQRFDDAVLAYEKIDGYILTTVICAVVLFFAGIAPKFQSTRIQAGLISGAVCMLLVIVWNLISLSSS